MSYYYRKQNKNNFEDDIKDLNNKIDTIYTSLSNIIEERNNLLEIFNSRIPIENIFNKDIKVDSDGKFKLIFTCKSKQSDIHKYIFHMFIKSDFNKINLKFLINNKDFIYDIVVNNFKYLKIEENFAFDKIETFKIYLKTDKPITIMKYSSYETIINYLEDTILNNQDHIKKLLNKSNKINTLNTKFDKINEIIDIIISDEYDKIYKTFFPIKNIHSEIIDIPLKKNSYIIFEYAFNSKKIDIPLIIKLKIDGVLEKNFNIVLKEYNKITYTFKLDYNVTKIKFDLYLLNDEKILFNNKKIKFNIFSHI